MDIWAKTSSSVWQSLFALSNISADLKKEISVYECRHKKKLNRHQMIANGFQDCISANAFCLFCSLMWTVYLHATKAHSNMIGQCYPDYKHKPELCKVCICMFIYQSNKYLHIVNVIFALVNLLFCLFSVFFLPR